MEQSIQVLSLQLFNRKARPSFVFSSNNIEITALFDTGATAPVWCMGEKKFLKAYPSAIKQLGTCEISGFGTDAEHGLIYTIPYFKLQDNNSEYVIKNLQLAVCMHPQIGYDFVMSDTMFSKADTFIYRRGQKKLEILYDKSEYICAVKTVSNTFSISTYTQDFQKA